MAMECKRNQSIDLIRGFAIIMVVLGHAIQATMMNGDRSWLWEIIKSFQMPLLFLVSGFTAGFSYPKVYKDHFMFIHKKIKRLLIPYIAWEMIHYLLVCCTGTAYRTFGFSSFLYEFFVSDFWFLRYLFMFFLVLWGCNELWLTLHLSHELSGVILIVSTGLILILDKVPVVTESVSLMHWFYFVLGWLFYQALQSNAAKFIHNNKVANKMVITVSFCGVVVCGYVIASKLLVSLLMGIPMTVFCFVFLYYSFGFLKNRMCKGLVWLGRSTLLIYAIHWCVLFSPLWRINFYTKFLGMFPLSVRVFLVFTIWLGISIGGTWGIRQKKILKKVLAGE